MGRAARSFSPLLVLASCHLMLAPRALAGDGVSERAPSTTPEARRLRVELGLEYDTNPQRSETATGGTAVAITPSPLARAIIAWSTSSVLSEHHDLGLALSVAAKRFFEKAAQTEDVLLVDEAARWTWHLAPWAATGLAVSYDEAMQRHLIDFRDRPASLPLPEPRDYRAVTGQARLSLLSAGGWGLHAVAGGRSFFYKPIPDASFLAPQAGLDIRFQHDSESDEHGTETDGGDSGNGGVEWDVAAGLDLEERFFSGLRRVGCPDPSICLSAEDPSTFQRDAFWQGHLEATRTGFLLLGLRYAFQVNDSNSYQSSVVRHLLSARVATRLPGDLFLAARGEIVWAHYRDSMNLTIDSAGKPYATFEDENRSNARLELSRRLPAGLELAARWSGYASALGSAGNYRRQTFMLLTSWTWN